MRATLLALALALLAGPAEAKKKRYEEGVPISIVVLDEEGHPIPTAVVRNPNEADRHRVNSLTGTWEASVLYLPDGGEIVFQPGMSVLFEVSAPGYMTRIIQYDVRKRRNKVEVVLEKLDLDDTDIEEPIIQFGRDRPREEGGTGPAN